MEKKNISIYTDGSCNTQFKIGGWAAIVLVDNEKKIISGSVFDTTHNRMELQAVIEAIEYVLKNLNKHTTIHIYTDSQYVFRIPERAKKLLSTNFITSKGKLLHNKDLIEKLIELIEKNNVQLTKVKAHQKGTEIPNYNRIVDKLSRKIVRENVIAVNNSPDYK